MDCGGEDGDEFRSSNAIEIVPEGSEASEADAWITPFWGVEGNWMTDGYYRVDSGEPNSSPAQLQTQNKKPRTSTKSKEIGKMFFKTRLCGKFRDGCCQYVANCNFAHGIEELRPPPPNWQEVLAAHNEEAPERMQVAVMPVQITLMGERERHQKARHCKKFYTGEGCPYGDQCIFLHDEQSKARESVAISLAPLVGGGKNGAGANGASWKTRICNKWEMTGYCPFEGKCHFAHGAAELRSYGEMLVEVGGAGPCLGENSKQVCTSTKAP